jgi:peptidoglycan/xylan/chitin deacetylase (PgdA/CDA1 family)
VKCDIVMYHYVRPIEESRYSKIKGLELIGFERQLKYFLKEKRVVSTTDVVNAALGGDVLPSDAVWLTFDDGYKDHYEFVVPILEKIWN